VIFVFVNDSNGGMRSSFVSTVCLLGACANDGFNVCASRYTLDRPPAGWKYSTGFINKDMVKEHLPPPAEDTMIFFCGPPPMYKFALEPAAKELGFSEDQLFSF
jgi:NAD(P)H-flavin reductase